jgi:release factor glutamine methyltransferase
MLEAGEKLLKYVWKDAALRLKKVGVKTSLLDSRLLLQNVLNITYEDLLVSASRLVSDEENEKFEMLLSRRINREPVSKILEYKDFWKYRFKTNQHTLDPRPESETLIESVLGEYKDFNRDLKILDLGTGSGCLILTLLKEYKNATGLGVDISMEALKVATENAQNLEVADRVKFQKGNWLAGIDEKFDIIISNPPYIKTAQIDYLQDEVRLFDPLNALDGGESGVEPYKIICKDVGKVMNNYAKVFFEIGKWQENDISTIIRENSFDIIAVKNDLLGIPRIISFRKPHLKVVG